MARRNTTVDVEPTITSLALELSDGARLRDWLDQHPNIVTDKKTGVKREVRRNVTLSSGTVPEDLYIATVKYASEQPGGLTTNGQGKPDVSSGVLGRVVRAPLFREYLGWDVQTAAKWEADREAAISAARSDRMSAIAAARGENLEAFKAKITAFDSLRGNDAVMAALKASDPDTYALIMDFDAES